MRFAHITRLAVAKYFKVEVLAYSILVLLAILLSKAG
jgi:hypothetical protein